jgi:hypothetical protein
MILSCRLPAHAPMVLLAVALLCTGCGDGTTRVPVQGTVNLNGAPVDGGKIMFIPKDKDDRIGFANAPIQNGKFTIEPGPSLGNHRVEIVWYKKTGKQVASSDLPVDEKIQVVPDIYNERSTLSVEVKAGMEPLKYDLTGDAPRGGGETGYQRSETNSPGGAGVPQRPKTRKGS